MSEVVADVQASRRDVGRLKQVLLVAAAWGFFAIIAVSGGRDAALWPLFSIPTVLAGLLLYVPGSLIFGALSALAVFVLAPNAPPQTWAGIVAFAVAGAIAGETARRLDARSRALAAAVVVDPETGACTETYLAERVAEEVRRCMRYSCSCALLRVSVDRFDAFAEKFGARKGDALIARLAELVRTSVRETDVVGRVDQHDIGVLLPFASQLECETVARRIERAVADARFEGDSVEPAVAVTASVSWGVFPQETDSAEGLFDLTERRLAVIRSEDPERGESA